MNELDPEQVAKEARAAIEACQEDRRRCAANDLTLTALRKLLGAGFSLEPARFTRSTLESLLQDADWKKRVAGLLILGHYWQGDSDFIDEIMQISASDENQQVRGVALLAMGRLMKESRNGRVGSYLARRVRDASVPVEVRAGAYVALCILHGATIPFVFGASDMLREVDDGVIGYYVSL